MLKINDLRMVGIPRRCKCLQINHLQRWHGNCSSQPGWTWRNVEKFL